MNKINSIANCNHHLDNFINSIDENEDLDRLENLEFRIENTSKYLKNIIKSKRNNIVRSTENISKDLGLLEEVFPSLNWSSEYIDYSTYNKCGGVRYYSHHQIVHIEITIWKYLNGNVWVEVYVAFSYKDIQTTILEKIFDNISTIDKAIDEIRDTFNIINSVIEGLDP